MASIDLPCIGCDTQEGCGTGMGNWPKPGDPDNNSLLTATPGYGGVQLRWTYPKTNPQAVAHTLLYKSTIPDFESSALLVTASGDYYFDSTSDSKAVEYYYWIQIVSVHGTHGDVIGPASAIPLPEIEKFMQLLTGKIDQGLLAQSLKEDIGRIGSIEDNLRNEIYDRETANQRLAEALGLLDTNVTQAINYLDDEIIARKEGQNALTQRITTLVAANQDAFSAIRTEEAARVAADQALAGQINTVQSSLGPALASVRQEMETNIREVDGKLMEINARWTAQVSANGLVGGFGVATDGSSVEAGFDVDRFWVGRTNDNKIKPFIIEGDVVYINDAAINKLTFDKLRDSTGNVVVQNGKLKAEYMNVSNLSALTSNMGTITAGVLKSADGKFVIDLNNKYISITV